MQPNGESGDFSHYFARIIGQSDRVQSLSLPICGTAFALFTVRPTSLNPGA
jgi:hypothetical protein